MSSVKALNRIQKPCPADWANQPAAFAICPLGFSTWERFKLDRYLSFSPKKTMLAFSQDHRSLSSSHFSPSSPSSH